MIKIFYCMPNGEEIQMHVSRSIYAETIKALIEAGCEITEVRSDD